MATTEPMVRLQIKGHIQGNQTWSTSLWLRLTQTTDFISQATLDNITGNASTFAQTMCTSLSTVLWGSGTQADSLEGSWYGGHGDKPSLVSFKTWTPIAGVGSALMPAYVSAVTSFRSSSPSRSGRGRSYMPATLATACSSSANQFSSGAVTNVNAAWLGFINSLNAMTTPAEVTAHRVAIRSSSTNHALDVVRIVTDSLPDVQHRRADKLLASSVVAAIPT